MAARALSHFHCKSSPSHGAAYILFVAEQSCTGGVEFEFAHTSFLPVGHSQILGVEEDSGDLPSCHGQIRS